MAWQRDYKVAWIGAAATILAAIIALGPALMRSDSPRPPASAPSPVDSPSPTPGPTPAPSPDQGDKAKTTITFASFDPEDYPDGTYEEQGMKTCAKAYAVAGIHVSNNRVLCRRVIANSEEANIDTIPDAGTQREGMHACPKGRYMRGYHDEKNLLLCSKDLRRSGSPPEVQDPLPSKAASQGYGIHVCPFEGTISG